MYENEIPITKNSSYEGNGIQYYRITGTFAYQIENNGIVITIPEGEEQQIELAGDCVFNFKKDGKAKGIYKVIKEEIESAKEEKQKSKLEKLKEEWDYCLSMHHSPYNFSLIPGTGGMNNQKKCDRPDCLLYALDHLYKNLDEKKGKATEGLENEYERCMERDGIKGECEQLKDEIYRLQNKAGAEGKAQVIQYRKKGMNDIIAFDFLRKTGSVENYAKLFYHLDVSHEDEKQLLHDMIELGEKEIPSEEMETSNKDIENIEMYLNLAVRYWKMQRKKYEEKVKRRTK